MKKIIYSIILGTSLLIAPGCSEDYLERVPTNSVTDESLFSTRTMTIMDDLVRNPSISL